MPSSYQSSSKSQSSPFSTMTCTNKFPTQIQSKTRLSFRSKPSHPVIVASHHTTPPPSPSSNNTRRSTLLNLIATTTTITLLPLLPPPPPSFAIDDEPLPVLCDESCSADVNAKPRTKTPSGLEYVDITPGKGVSPPIGYQVVVNYVAMTPEGRVFASSLGKGKGYDIRVGTGQVIPGLDEGLATMKSGGIRRLYIPGNLSYPKGLPAGPGRPRVMPSSPVVFDVQLLLIPGMDDNEE